MVGMSSPLKGCAMNSTLQNHPRAIPRTIAIVRALPGLGDFLCLVPALRALHYAFPAAEIVLIGLPQVRSWVDRFRDYLQGFLEFPGFPGIPEVPFLPDRTARVVDQIRRLKFDWVLQLHGNGSCINRFALLLGARMSAGFFPVGQSCPDPKSFLPYPEQASEVWRSLKLIEFLGVPLRGDALEFPLDFADWQAWESLTDRYHLPINYVCLHPGASGSHKRWSPEQFAIVGDALVERGLSVVLTGTAAEAQLTKTVAQKMTYEAIDLAGQTDLGCLAVLLKKSRLLVCNDTGISHLAAALKVNSVVVFSGSDPQRWAPQNRLRHRIVISDRGDSETSQDTAIQVLEEATNLLSQEYFYVC
jgi:ADP-heptose:LPS heptosyltransferase